jgi:4a-hydroxytetrahydrobiopterin dehydratase
VPPLKGEDLGALAKQVDGWNVVEEHHITRTFKFPNFREALTFVNRVGELSEAQGHHPDIFLAWGRVEVTSWTTKSTG